MAGEFETLLPFTWRGLHLPYTHISVSLAHDLVEHKYWGVNGARVEDTGVAPVRFSATIPICNSIYPGKNEKWFAGALYPDALRNFIIAFQERTTGLLQHPEFGEVSVKPERMDFEFTGDRQDSTEIKASWVETLDEKVLTKIQLPARLDIELAAADLEKSGQDLRKLAPGLPQFKEDFESLARKLTGLVDLVSVLSYRVLGIVNRIIYRAHLLETAIQRLTSGQMTQVTSLRPFTGYKRQALLWPAMEALQRIQAGAYSVRKSALASSGVGLYTVPAQTTLPGVLQALPSSVSVADVLKMNPDLARGPVVSKGSVVRYPIPK